MKDIKQLQELGFNVTKTKALTTVVEHSKPFDIVTTSGQFASVLNESTNQYSVTFSGLCSSGQIPHDVQLQTPKTLLQSINEAANAKPAQIDVTPTKTSKSTVKFATLSINESYSKDEQASSTYVKVSDTTARKLNSIGSQLEIFVESDFDVYPFDDNGAEFTDGDIEHYIETCPFVDEFAAQLQGGQPNEQQINQLRAQVADDLENIPGLESLDDQGREVIIGKLVAKIVDSAVSKV
jgi:hypothetical protein